MKLEHLEATKCIFQLTEEEKGEWVAAAVAKESWVAGSSGTNEGDSGGGKKEEEEDEEEGVWGGWKQHISFCFLPCFLIVHFCGFNVFCGALFWPTTGGFNNTPTYLLQAYASARANGLMSQLAPPSCSLVALLPNTRYAMQMFNK